MQARSQSKCELGAEIMWPLNYDSHLVVHVTNSGRSQGLVRARQPSLCEIGAKIASRLGV